MLDNSISITYDSGTVVMKKIREDNYTSRFAGVSGNNKLYIDVKHSFPSVRGGGGESHLVRFDVEHYTAEGVYMRTSSAWNVIKTFDGAQDADDSALAQAGLESFLGVSGVVASVIAGES